MAISHCYWHLVVNNGNFTYLQTSRGPEWEFQISTDIQWSTMAILYCSWHLVVNNGNFILQFASIPIRHRRHLCYFKSKYLGNCYFKMHLTPNMYKIVTLQANAKKIVTLKCIWHHICTKLLLWRQMLRKSSLENAFGTKYVQNHNCEGKC